MKTDARRAAGYVGLTIGLSMALAANLAYAVPKGPVVIGVGLCCPLVLPLALAIRSTLPKGGGWWKRVSMELATLAVAGPAAAISYAHSYSLLLEHDPRWSMIAVLAPLSADGLAALSTLALSGSGVTSPSSRPRARTAPQPARSRPQAPRDETGPGSAPTPAAEQALPDRIAGHLLHRRARRAMEGRTPETPAEENAVIVAEFGCSPITIKRGRKRAKERGELAEAQR